MTHIPNTPVLPVRVWVGYSLPRYRHLDTRADFCEKLGSIFMPATVQLMQPWGLTAYLPCIVPLDDDPAAPDEIAIVFYVSVEAYHQATQMSVGGRAYGLLHQTVFNFQNRAIEGGSHSGFAEHFEYDRFGEHPDGEYYLFGASRDWQCSITRTMACLHQGSDTSDFHERIAKWARSLQQAGACDRYEVIFSLCNRVLVVWINADSADTVNESMPAFDNTKVLVDSFAESLSVPLDVSSAYDGVAAREGQLLNLCFDVDSGSGNAGTRPRKGARCAEAGS